MSLTIRTASLVLSALILTTLSSSIFAYGPKEAPEHGEIKIPISVSAKMPADTEKFAVHSVPGSYFGINPASRGSAIVGLLLGPLGVALNSSYNEREGQRQGNSLRELLAFDLATLLKTKLNSNPSNLPNTPGKYFELIPAAFLSFVDEDKFSAACALNAVLKDEAGAEKWRARYISYSDPMYAASDTQTTPSLLRELPDCMSRAYSLFQSHIKGDYATAPAHYADLGSVSVVLFIPEKQSPGRTIVLDNIGVSEMTSRMISNIRPK